ncbi:class II glutamine amidotransferase [Rhodopirellula sp. MGV]|uniref:class II glutamine amidotransferase n=1 Tax=Rhodopirellula sp. MGV TaxID=2023130 RepID=UPI000B97809F|nr:class II glutamine amidotransferase [Rhodopirellula sp. MGV]OYP32974.1 hypothetical protein CGZ80_18925 [Rhodopirellula sp. MGV]PNY35369.1 class II glutamine amidotransferase [Rhodopirellula baltica]
MCRWLAYFGDPIRLDKLLYCAEDAFIGQSLHSRRSTTPVNGDGSGLGWYGDSPRPGVFHTIRPAWNSGNLRNLSDQLNSHLFFAHVRATSGTAIQESNCHPFRYEHVLFQHNGFINGYDKLKQSLDMAVDAELYPLMQGSTDTERMFYLALTFGLLDNVQNGLTRMVRFVEKTATAYGIKNAISMTVAVGLGDCFYAARYSTSGNSPTLFHSNHLQRLKENSGQTESIPQSGSVVLSEPLDDVHEHWTEIPESTLVRVCRDGLSMSPFCQGATCD